MAVREGTGYIPSPTRTEEAFVAEENGESQPISVNVPIGAVAMAVALGVAGAAYLLLGRSEEAKDAVAGTAEQVTRSGRGMARKAGLTALIALIENDATRRLVVSALKAIRNRA
jgi:hypothetical protein